MGVLRQRRNLAFNTAVTHESILVPGVRGYRVSALPFSYAATSTTPFGADPTKVFLYPVCYTRTTLALPPSTS